MTRVDRSRPIKLAVVLDNLFVGGVEVLLLNLFKAFDPLLVEPYVICLKAPGPLAPEFEESGFEVVTIERSGRYDLSTLPRLISALRSRRTDVAMVSHHQLAALVFGPLAARLAGVPIVVAAHDMDLVPQGRRVFPPWAARGLAGVDRLVLLSQAQGRYLHEQEGVGRFPWERTPEVVIPNGIPIGNEPGPAEREQARQKLGLASEDVVIGVIARLMPAKAHEVLFEALVTALPQAPNLRVALFGDGPRREELEGECERLGIADRVEFLGVRRDVTELMPGLDISCLSSINEGVPIALLESMAMGLPIVATDCGSVAEVVGDGEAGFIVPIRDPDALAERLVQLAQDPDLRRSMGKVGRQKAEGTFNIQRTSSGYQDMLAQLVSR